MFSMNLNSFFFKNNSQGCTRRKSSVHPSGVSEAGFPHMSESLGSLEGTKGEDQSTELCKNGCSNNELDLHFARSLAVAFHFFGVCVGV